MGYFPRSLGSEIQLNYFNISTYYIEMVLRLVREPAILLIKWLRTKGLKMFAYVEKYAEFKNQTLKKNRLIHKNATRSGIPRG